MCALTSTKQTLTKERHFHVEGQTLIEKTAKNLASRMVPELASYARITLLSSTRNVSRVRQAHVVGLKADTFG